MFGFFKSKKTKAAKELLAVAYKVYNYRCDIIAESDAKDMSQMIEDLDELILDGKVHTKDYDALSEKLEKLMRKCGGTIYPLTTIADYVDMIVVAGILALGIRQYFLQPFKIPTNSMFPTFYGMTSQVYKAGENAPNFPERLVRFALKGASNYNLTAPADGDLYIEVSPPDGGARVRGFFACDIVPVRAYFVWPTQERRYNMSIGGVKVPIAVPADFPMDSVIAEAFPEAAKNPAPEIVLSDGKYMLKLGSFKKGDRLLNFDILSGDMLFVDRVTYNFRKPKIGDAIVFKTKYCEGMTRLNGGVPDDKYYIKRLVGVGGDKLKVENGTLYRNGEPITGSIAFALNAQKKAPYRGYMQEGALADGNIVDIPQKFCYAMGDNSANSLDSRFWGFVPERALVGKSLIIFYPFTNRWGATK